MHSLLCIGRIVAVGSLFLSASLAAQETTFSYQGHLERSGTPFTGVVDMEATLFDSLDGGTVRLWFKAQHRACSMRELPA